MESLYARKQGVSWPVLNDPSAGHRIPAVCSFRQHLETPLSGAEEKSSVNEITVHLWAMDFDL